jgi:hypothetical protein
MVSVGDRVRQGSMQPLYAEIALADGSRFNAICKFPTRDNRAPTESVINEWMGTEIARVSGTQVPPCYLVETTPHVQLHLVEHHGVSVSSTIGFASKVCPIDGIIYPGTLNAMEPEDLARLYCVDMLLINADRTPFNPNCGHSKRKLFAYDFGSALFSPGTTNKSFDRSFFGPGMADRAEAHLCRAHLTSEDTGASVLRDVIDRLCKDRWYGRLNAKFLPQALQNHLRLVVEYLDFIAQERDMLTRQIVSTL